MAVMVLGNDITNGHHVSDEAVDDLVRDCQVRRVGGHEAQAVYECCRASGNTFHIVVTIPGHGHDVMVDHVDRTRREATGKAVG